MTNYRSVLLIEDDEVDVLNVRRAFRKRGFTQELNLAKDGIEALSMLENTTTGLPDLILLDLNMPRMGGFEFLKKLKESPFAGLDVYVMSTSSEDTDKDLALELGASGYIIKPLYTDQFADELAQILG
ncbi:MAG: response regulator [Bacteroidetes bacterium]|nr:MAG: response regulator [Bacteroidota bacterium]